MNSLLIPHKLQLQRNRYTSNFCPWRNWN